MFESSCEAVEVKFILVWSIIYFCGWLHFPSNWTELNKQLGRLESSVFSKSRGKGLSN